MVNFSNPLKLKLLVAGTVLLALFTATILSSLAEGSDSGVFPDRIVFGQTAPLSGSTQAIGNNLRVGINVAFEEINQTGGVNGRRLVLISRDDRYEPDVAIDNTRKLIEIDQVFALVGVSGTPTAKAAISVSSKDNIPFIAPLTGGEFLRDRMLYPNTINLRPSYSQETEAWIEYLSSVGITRIAVFYQDDAFGRSGLRGIRNALSKRGILMVARGAFSRN